MGQLVPREAGPGAALLKIGFPGVGGVVGGRLERAGGGVMQGGGYNGRLVVRMVLRVPRYCGSALAGSMGDRVGGGM